MATERTNCEKFKHGLRHVFYEKVAVLHIRKYSRLVNWAMLVEGIPVHANQVTKADQIPKPKDNDNQPRPAKKQRIGAANGEDNANKAPIVECNFCHRKNHTEETCCLKNKTCFQCGAKDHFAKNCPQMKPETLNMLMSENWKPEFNIRGECMLCSKVCFYFILFFFLVVLF